MPRDYKGPGYVLDMYSSTIHGNTAVEADAADDDDVRLNVDETTFNAMRSAIEKGKYVGETTVMVKRRVGQRRATIAINACIEKAAESVNPKRFLEIKFRVTWPEDEEDRLTLITVEFGRDGDDHWIRLQGNPTTTMTGQNRFPLQRTFKSPRREKMLMFGWPYLTFLSICKAFDPSFKAPSSLVKKILRGHVTCQNVQFALYMPMPNDDKASFYAVLGAGFRATRVRGFENRPGLEAFDIGARLGIVATPYWFDDSTQPAPWDGMMLCKASGTHEIATVTFYDKAEKDDLDPDAPDRLALSGFLRVDITPKPRGIEKIFSAALKLANEKRVELDLDRNVNDKIINSVGNIVSCIDLFDEHFKVKIGKGEHERFRGWLVTEMLFKEFYLSELFGFTPKRWARVTAWMKQWSDKDKRYKDAFEAWRNAETAATTLREYLIAHGFSQDTAATRIKEINELGFSGDIPPIYWTNRRTLSRSWGSTDAEETEYWRLKDAGQPTAHLEDRWQERQVKAFQIARRGIARFQRTHTLLSRPVAGTVMLIKSNEKAKARRRRGKK